MSQRQRFRQIFIKPQLACNRAGDLRDFKSVRQAGPVMIAFVKQKNLRLVSQPAKGRRMQDAVAIALKRAARWTLGLSVEAAATRHAIGGIASRAAFARLQGLAVISRF